MEPIIAVWTTYTIKCCWCGSIFGSIWLSSFAILFFWNIQTAWIPLLGCFCSFVFSSESVSVSESENKKQFSKKWIAWDSECLKSNFVFFHPLHPLVVDIFQSNESAKIIFCLLFRSCVDGVERGGKSHHGF